MNTRAFEIRRLRKNRGSVCSCRAATRSLVVCDPPYRIRALVRDGGVRFGIDCLVYGWHDDGAIGGPPLAGGRIGFGQVAPMIAGYDSMEVQSISLSERIP